MFADIVDEIRRVELELERRDLTRLLKVVILIEPYAKHRLKNSLGSYLMQRDEKTGEEELMGHLILDMPDLPEPGFKIVLEMTCTP